MFAVFVALVGIGLLIEVVACSAWSLSGAGKADIDGMAAKKWQPAVDLSTPVHRIREWDGPRVFQEAPMLQQRVAQNELEPVEQRLPEDPLVIEPPQQIGPYGGTWPRYADRPNDIQISNIYIASDSLIRYNPRGDGMQVNIARKYEISPDGRCYTFYLRKGMRWSDGQPFNADDVEFWWNHVLSDGRITPTLPQAFRSGGEVATFEKLDDYSFRFTFKEPNGMFLHTLAFRWSGDPVGYPAHYLRQFHPHYNDEARLDEMAVQAGFKHWYELFGDRASWKNPECPRLAPWVIVKPPPAQPVVYQRNPYYWKVDTEGNQLPYIDLVEYEIYDLEVINFKIIAGQIGFQDRFLRADSYPLLRENAKRGQYRVLNWLNTGDNVSVLCFNLNHKDPVLRDIFNKKEFRIAASHAINRPELNQLPGTFGMGSPSQVCPPPHSPYHDPKLAEAYTQYDPQLANRMLDAIGLDKRDSSGVRLRPDGKPLRFFLETSADSRMNELLCQYLQEVGIDMQLKVEARDLFYQRKLSAAHDAATWPGADGVIPQIDPRFHFPFSDESLQAVDWARWYESDGRLGDEPPPEVQECMRLYREIRRTLDEDKQRELFQKIMDLDRENLWVIGTLRAIPTFVLVKDNFKNVPEVAAGPSAAFRSPGNAAPECWAIEPK